MAKSNEGVNFMKINALNVSSNQDFGANPNKIFYSYIKKSLPKAGNSNAAEIGMQVMDRLEKIDAIFAKKPLNMLMDNSNSAVVNLDDVFLLTVDRNEPIVGNLDKIINALNGRMQYLKCRNRKAYNRRINIDNLYNSNKNSRKPVMKEIRNAVNFEELI